jgi:sugar-phosphatase
MLVRCEALLFDLDGVLVDSRVAVERHWRQFAGWFDLTPESVLAGAHGRRSRDVIARALAPRLVDAALKRFEALEVDDVEGVVALPGAAAILRSLRRTPWAVVSSASRTLALSRLRAASLPAPPAIVSADDVAAGKPDPAGYVLGARTLRVSPERCAAFEDSPPGLIAALQAGSTAIGLTTTHTRDELMSAVNGLELVVADLSAVDATEDGGGLTLELRC